MDHEDQTIKMTFKEYWDITKKQLVEALNNTPQQVVEYKTTRYCRLTVGESLKEKQTIPLKPGHVFTVKWLYENMETPLPKKINFFNVNNLDPNSELDLYWTPSQLDSWLSKNTKINS